MTLNTARIGRDRCAELIIEYLKIKFGDDILEKKGTIENDKALEALKLI